MDINELSGKVQGVTDLNLKTVLLGLFMLGGFAPNALAQTPDETSAAAENTDATDELSNFERVLPEVQVFGGPRSWRKGLEAYYSGDYPTAERHFKSFRNQLNSTLLDIDFSDFELDGGGGLGPRNFNNSVVFNSLSGRSQLGAFSRIRENERQRERRPRAGISQLERNAAQASYAVGASLVQQGKYSQAKRFFSSAIGRDHTMHDARTRLGLIALIEDDRRTAGRRLGQLERWCDSTPCDGTGELAVAVQTLRNAISSYDQAAEQDE